MTLRLPPWLRQNKRDLARLHVMQKHLRGHRLHTVCEQARCPNIGECFGRNTATYLLMGPTCTRGCGFCNMTTAPPAPPDPHEPREVARSAAAMNLRHVVLTSVTRDDLPMGGAEHFLQTVLEVKELLPAATVEVLTPDFQGSIEALKIIALAPIDVFNHNLETVSRLYPTARPQADYRRSLAVLRSFKQLRPTVTSKSGFMLGLGETDAEVEILLHDLREAGVEAVTIGQYLRPRLAKLPVVRYVEPARFAQWAAYARRAGFRRVAAAPLIRSSYQAENML